ncbi:MAG: HAMP domain-containing histidine kinase [Sciscionella sp.]|nr:HAMP domain-containing histidine kinase [Sciscionella sp.]
MRLVGRLTRRWTLRTRLLVALLALCAVGLTVVGAASIVLLRHALVLRVEQQLNVATKPWQGITSAKLRPLASYETSLRPIPGEFSVVIFNPDGSADRPLDNQRQKSGAPQGPVLSEVLDNLNAGTAQPFTVADNAGGAAWLVRTVPTGDGRVAAIGASLEATDDTLYRLVLIELIAGASVLVLLGVVATAVVRLGLRPLTRIEQTAGAVAGGELDRRIDGANQRTETGRLAGALNVMLGRLSSALRERERSEERMRRFVGDASHELRTPLTSIRGFAELYRRGGATSEHDVRRLMGRIEAEATRMGLLVDDLLLLARLDEQRSLDLTEVDLGTLAADAVDAARVRDPEREISLDTQDKSVRVLGDEHRLRQVLTNLVGNALTHTPAGTPVRIDVRLALPGNADGVDGIGDDVDPPPIACAGVALPADREVGIVEVTDRGAGVAGQQATKVFDRFFRADAGRSRSSGGAGLGLAITAAIVEVHHGRIELRSQPGNGASFRVSLPTS